VNDDVSGQVEKLNQARTGVKRIAPIPAQETQYCPAQTHPQGSATQNAQGQGKD